MVVKKTDVFEKWINTLKDAKAKIIITARIKRLENGNFGDCKFIRQKVYELRIDYAKGYRLYFITQKNTIVLILLGGDKSTQSSDIEKAVKMAEEIV
ncbi:MAG: type II toxin-antitoxin system RelE/ParE family toxin [Candidatus Fimenecus sp.]